MCRNGNCSKRKEMKQPSHMYQHRATANHTDHKEGLEALPTPQRAPEHRSQSPEPPTPPSEAGRGPSRSLRGPSGQSCCVHKTKVRHDSELLSRKHSALEYYSYLCTVHMPPTPTPPQLNRSAEHNRTPGRGRRTRPWTKQQSDAKEEGCRAALLSG